MPSRETAFTWFDPMVSMENFTYFMTVSHKQASGVFALEEGGGDCVSVYSINVCQNEIQVLKTMVVLC